MSKLTGVEANHSSTKESVAPADSQDADVLNDIPVSLDPNISGTAPTEDTYTWLAGGMSAWQENDDYREFFEDGRRVAESATTHRFRTVHDGDYDDNRGHPIAIGHAAGHTEPDGPLHNEHGTETSALEFALAREYQRRL